MRQLFDQDLRVYVHSEPVDMRKSYDALFKLVRSNGILKGGIFIFIAKNRKRAKALLWNKTGLMIMMQRLEEGKFADVLRRGFISRDELISFFEGDSAIKKINLHDNRTDKSLNLLSQDGKYEQNRARGNLQL